MKQYFLCTFTLLLFCAAMPAETFHVTSPAGGETWMMGSTHTVSFKLDSPITGPIFLLLYKTNTLIGYINVWQAPVAYQPGTYDFPWVVGPVKNINTGGSEAISVGSGYTVKATTQNGSPAGESNAFTIAFDISSIREKLGKIIFISTQWAQSPGCPYCGILEMSELGRALAGTPESLGVSLFYNGQPVSSLGKTGPGMYLASRQEVKFSPDAQAAILKGNAQFELRLFDASGKLVLTHPIALK